ncbi:MAG TPA: c-type cytochrome [Polyangia bacterium]
MKPPSPQLQLRQRRVPVVVALMAGLAAIVTGACDDEVLDRERGAELFESPALSTSRFNKFSCATCHAKVAGGAAVIVGRWDSGYNLDGVTARASWWGGGAVRLLDAINVCVEQFMGGRALVAADPATRQLGAFLAEGAPATPLPAAPFTVAKNTTSLTELTGDPGKGAAVYVAGCQRCHGAAHTGAGRLDATVSVIPEDTIRLFPDRARAAFVEKLRHGRFFNIGGIMPFYTLEALSDADVADLMAYVGL